MVIAVLLLVGLCLGSFVNALVWRLREQELETGKKKPNKEYLKQLSIRDGRSMCPHCKHELAAKDLVPLLSWLSVRGRCRYCHKPISAQYPLVELITAGLFAASYLWWPVAFSTSQKVIFVLWLALIVGFMALIVYDLRWQLLPNRIVYPLGVVAALLACVAVASAGDPIKALLDTALAVLIGGGIFYALFQFSEGKWIGGGDVKLGWLLGLVVGTPGKSFLLIFLGALFGSLVSLPLLASKKLQRTSTIPFGPFLIVGAIIAYLFGTDILHWYRDTFINL
jgi:prepilin signal peptidase PulO-like enzyme (type II secretory pathway)